jgi:DNA-binding XRE family transcriptional regulator
VKSLFTEEQFKLAKIYDLLPCECYQCSSTFYITKHYIKRVLNPNSNKRGMYCSKKCQSISQITKLNVVCTNCGKEFKKIPSQITKNNFCSSSCSVRYNNTHKTKGYRRSKLEKYLETELIKLYSDLKILFNNKTTINSELDIYIPELKLAFELNGIFHYEPIYGKETLNQIQNNDNHKFHTCIEQGIDLCIIDVSQQKYFKIETSKKYLDIITNIIKERLLTI